MRAMTGHAVNQYLHLSHNLTTPVVNLNPYGYNYMQGSFPIERVCSLSLMQTKVRPRVAPSVAWLEKEEDEGGEEDV